MVHAADVWMSVLVFLEGQSVFMKSTQIEIWDRTEIFTLAIQY